MFKNPSVIITNQTLIDVTERSGFVSKHIESKAPETKVAVNVKEVEVQSKFKPKPKIVDVNPVRKSSTVDNTKGDEILWIGDHTR